MKENVGVALINLDFNDLDLKTFGAIPTTSPTTDLKDIIWIYDSSPSVGWTNSYMDTNGTWKDMSGTAVENVSRFDIKPGRGFYYQRSQNDKRAFIIKKPY